MITSFRLRPFLEIDERFKVKVENQSNEHGRVLEVLL